jgi:hypothetical protein
VQCMMCSRSKKACVGEKERGIAEVRQGVNGMGF